MDLSLQKKAERIRHWINNEPNGYVKLIRQMRSEKGYDPSMNFIAIILDEPECFPKQIKDLAQAIATLRLTNYFAEKAITGE